MHPLKVDWVSYLVRIGYSARGVIYFIIGTLTVFAAFGAASTQGPKGALRELFSLPLGTTLAWIMVVGLTCYAGWRLIQTIGDTDNHGWSPKGLAIRMGLLASALTYTTLAIYALTLMGVWSPDSSDQSSWSIASTIAGVAGYNVAALLLAIIFVGVASAHFWKAWQRKYADHLIASPKVMRYIDPISRAGLCARGIVFTVISLLLIYRGLMAKPSGNNAPDLTDALTFMASLPAGAWLLAAMGVGLLLFAIYSFCEGWWRQINVEDASLSKQV